MMLKNNTKLKDLHSPAPWSSDPEGEVAWTVEDACGKPIVDIFIDREDYDQISLKSYANEILVVASPRLYELVKSYHACHRAFSGNDNWTSIDDNVRKEAENLLKEMEVSIERCIKARQAPKRKSLRDKQDDMWADHPDYPKRDWKYEVDNDDTTLGYWEWVENKIEQEDEDD